ncbi:MAG: GAF domain-containing protein [Ruminococcaceae bacterium]|nr:GAF domain-containing protein [Oscillospiraceae bacterium]
MSFNFEFSRDASEKKQELYRAIEAISYGESDLIANLSNASAVIKLAYENTNWVGFYIFKDKELVLGPFQGKPACIRIPLGKGVCGTAAETKEIRLVPDVHKFPGHIACDSASNSEIVLPIIKNGALFGVLDMDSPSLSYFTEEDKDILSYAVEAIEKFI